MVNAMGLRVPMGVTIGDAAVVGSNATTLAHNSSNNTPKNSKQNKSPMASPSQGTAHLSMSAAQIGQGGRASLDGGSATRKRGSITVRLANVPSSIETHDIHQVLGPWHRDLASLTSCVSPGKESKTYLAEMPYSAALEAISELDQRLLNGHRLVVTGEGLEQLCHTSSLEDQQDPDLLL